MTRKIYHKPVPFTSRRPVPAYALISPDGTTYTRILDLHAFCLAHNLGYQQVYKLTKGEISEIKGWTRMG